MVTLFLHFTLGINLNINQIVYFIFSLTFTYSCFIVNILAHQERTDSWGGCWCAIRCSRCWCWYRKCIYRQLKVVLWSNFYPFDFLSVSHRIPWKNTNAIYRFQISALVQEIFKFEKWLKYANEMTDDVIHSTQCYIEFINKAIFANLQCRTLKLGRLVVLQKTHLWL